MAEKRLGNWSARGAVIRISALAWIIALAAAISGSLLVLCLATRKVSTSPLVPGSPASVVEFGSTGRACLDLSGTLADFLGRKKAHCMAVMQTSTRRAHGVVFVADVTIPYPWQRRWWRWRR